jgi:REP element-mobilizing transposase RayT
VGVGGMVYYAWNRANFRSRLFQTAVHYQDFLALVEESLNFVALRILAYCLMPNHWHLVLSTAPPVAGRCAEGLRGVAEPPPRERGNCKYPVCP